MGRIRTLCRVLESTPLEEEVEHTVDAITDDGATYRFKEPYYKIQRSHLPSVSREGIFGDDKCDYTAEKIFIQ